MGALGESAGSRQQSGRRHGQQTNPHRLVCAVQRQILSTLAAVAVGGRLMAMEKTLRLESTERFHFSTATTTGFIDVQRSAEERRNAKQRSNGVPENLHTHTVSSDRGV
jgi:hypothetical protein